MSELFTKEQKDAVIRALENPKYRWRTISGVAGDTGLPREIIGRIIEASGEEIVRSSVPSKTRESLYTTRRQFRSKAPLFARIQGVLKNRAD